MQSSVVKIPKKIITHSKRAINFARERGWHHGARYTNLRDVRHLAEEQLTFLDIDWKNYSFDRHRSAAEATRPHMTVARDVEDIMDLSAILHEADELALHADIVLIVPKDRQLTGRISELIPLRFLLGYSVPTRYGGTTIPLSSFDRPVHLLGGRPDTQRQLSERLDVYSIDCNRFTLDARFGDFFDGETFRPHPVGGYDRCLIDSIDNINHIWKEPFMTS